MSATTNQRIRDEKGKKIPFLRKITKSKQSVRQITREIQIQVRIASLMQSGFHLVFFFALHGGGGPGVVDGDVDGDGVEGDAPAGVGVVHDGHLLLNHRFGVAGGFGRRGDDMNVGVDLAGAADVAGGDAGEVGFIVGDAEGGAGEMLDLWSE